jgi:ABC-2 type transport system permease protein
VIAVREAPLSGRRIGAIFRRHYLAFRHNPPSVFDLFIWPMLDLFMWGIFTLFIRRSAGAVPAPVGFLLGGVLLWDIVFRGNIGISTAFLDDISWSRNVINFLVSPLRPIEYVLGAALWSVFKLVIGWSVLIVLAWVLFSFGIFTIGPVLAVYWLALMLFGFSLAMVVTGLVMRFGPGAEILAWGLAAVMMPLSAVFVPLRVLPGWAQAIASGLPSTHVFESMRGVLVNGHFRVSSLLAILALDAAYVAAAFVFAHRMYGTMRKRGYVTRYM